MFNVYLFVLGMIRANRFCSFIYPLLSIYTYILFLAAGLLYQTDYSPAGTGFGTESPRFYDIISFDDLYPNIFLSPLFYLIIFKTFTMHPLKYSTIPSTQSLKKHSLFLFCRSIPFQFPHVFYVCQSFL